MHIPICTTALQIFPILRLGELEPHSLGSLASSLLQILHTLRGLAPETTRQCDSLGERHSSAAPFQPALDSESLLFLLFNCTLPLVYQLLLFFYESIKCENLIGLH